MMISLSHPAEAEHEYREAQAEANFATEVSALQLLSHHVCVCVWSRRW